MNMVLNILPWVLAISAGILCLVKHQQVKELQTTLYNTVLNIHLDRAEYLTKQLREIQHALEQTKKQE